MMSSHASACYKITKQKQEHIPLCTVTKMLFGSANSLLNYIQTLRYKSENLNGSVLYYSRINRKKILSCISFFFFHERSLWGLGKVPSE